MPRASGGLGVLVANGSEGGGLPMWPSIRPKRSRMSPMLPLNFRQVPVDEVKAEVVGEIGRRQQVHGLAEGPAGEQVGAASGVGVGHTQGVGQVLD